MHRSLRRRSGQALRWESPASRAIPLPQDDKRRETRVLAKSWLVGHPRTPWVERIGGLALSWDSCL
jgi:hypothetical protein